MNKQRHIPLFAKMLWCVCGLGVLANTGWSQSANDWPVERLHTRDGNHPEGLLLSQRDDAYEFAEIVRPVGKPVYAVIRTIPTEQVLLYQPLENAARALLTERYVTIRHRALIEARQMEQVRLNSIERSNAHFWVYDGPWFTFYSTAEEQATRRAIVRLEQMFCAYRQLLPPRVKQVSGFQIYFYGTSREYREAQQARGWNVPHPALFAPQQNIVLAGSDWNAFQQELDRKSEQNARTREQWKLATDSYEEFLGQFALEMKRNGFTVDAVEADIRLRRAKWNESQKQLEKEIADAEQRNQAKFKEATEAIYRRLQHEAFHAYLENYVYPRDRFQVPRWLNEGLAQVFEFAQLDADTLRIDAPPPALLARWKRDLKTNRPLSLRDLLTDEQPLSAGHDTLEGASRHYLHAWALTYYLAFQQERLARQEFTTYLAKDNVPPLAKFERLVGVPWDDFERQWHADMQKLK